MNDTSTLEKNILFDTIRVAEHLCESGVSNWTIAASLPDLKSPPDTIIAIVHGLTHVGLINDPSEQGMDLSWDGPLDPVERTDAITVALQTLYNDNESLLFDIVHLARDPDYYKPFKRALLNGLRITLDFYKSIRTVEFASLVDTQMHCNTFARANMVQPYQMQGIINNGLDLGWLMCKNRTILKTPLLLGLNENEMAATVMGLASVAGCRHAKECLAQTHVMDLILWKVDHSAPPDTTHSADGGPHLNTH